MERFDEALAVQRMELQLLPLLVGRLARLVQHFRADLELSDVVHERRPVEAVELVAREPKLAAEAVRVRPNTLGVTAGDLVVDVEGGDELQQDLGGLLGRRRLVRPPH
jgi:hypothetical protein